jgi:hypothetical protein
MKVIAEFVDSRNGKRYQPGEGHQIKPALTADQVTRLKKAGCLADGNEKGAPAAPQESPSFEKMKSADLLALAELNRIVVVQGATDEQLVAALKAANVAPV